MYYDVFNGDADGICALHQLRLASPLPEARLITGVKRDIALLARITDPTPASITVLDVSLDSNRPFIDGLLRNGHSILYIDHHYAGAIPQHEHLQTHIDPSPDRCTSLIVDTLLNGRFRKWAICGAFGDTMQQGAGHLAATLSLAEAEIAKLREIGELLNYNGYGATLTDLFFHPADLYRAVLPFADPLDFFAASSTLTTLRNGFNHDMERAQAVNEEHCGRNRLYFFPGESWARRISGIFSNRKSQEETTAAHAILIANSDATYQVSVRAPIARRRDADTLCRQFPTGGGRTAAAGINALPAKMLDDFLAAFNATYS